MKISRFKIKTFGLISSVFIVFIIGITAVVSQTVISAMKDTSSAQSISALQASCEYLETNMKAVYFNTASFVETTLRDSISEIDLEQSPSSQYEPIRSLLNRNAQVNKNTYLFPGFQNYYLYFPGSNDLIISDLTYFCDVPPAGYLTGPPEYGYHWYSSAPLYYPSKRGVWLERSSDEYISRYIPIYKDGQHYATLSVNLSESYMQQTISSYFTMPGAQVYIVDEDGAIISSPDSSILGTFQPEYSHLITYPSQNQTISINDVDYLVNQYQSSYTSWYYISLIPMDYILESYYTIQNLMILLIGVLIFVSVLITLYISSYISRPLATLLSAIQQVARHDLSARIQQTRHDEFDTVFQGFNTMVQEISTLTHDLVNEKLFKKDMEIKLLQTQINPHFLYNTLETLYSMAKLDGDEEMATMVMAMSKFFRINLSAGRHKIPLVQAVEMAQHYVTIHNIRLSGNIQLSIHIDEKIKNYLVPKFLIQPLAENSIIHGFKNRSQQLKLKITAHAQEETLVITVTDNGCGISQDKLTQINQSLSSLYFEESLTQHFALRNINAQIRLSYGDGYGLTLQSTPGDGTTVTITLPFSSQDE